MMKKNSKIILSVILVGFYCVVAMAQDNSELAKKDEKNNFRLFNKTIDNAVKWLESQKSQESFEVSINEMLEKNKDPVTAALIAAKLYWLAGDSVKAISVLRNIIDKYGDVKDPILTTLPVGILGNLWIGTISRHFADKERATLSYKNATEIFNEKFNKDSDARYVTMLCLLYQAEIEVIFFGDKNKAIRNLENITKINIKEQKNHIAAEWEKLFQEWAAYKIMIMHHGIKEARAILNWKSKQQSSTYLIPVIMAMNGIEGAPTVSFYFNKRKILLYASLEQAIECCTSPIDRGLAQFTLGHEYEVCAKNFDGNKKVREKMGDPPLSYTKEEMYAKAEKYYNDLFNSESFFAPEGGIYLAFCQKKQSKDSSKFTATLTEVKKRFPGYVDFVDEILKSPDKHRPL